MTVSLVLPHTDMDTCAGESDVDLASNFLKILSKD